MNIVSAYLDLAENGARRHIPMTMEDWAKRLDIFLDEYSCLAVPEYSGVYCGR